MLSNKPYRLTQVTMMKCRLQHKERRDCLPKTQLFANKIKLLYEKWLLPDATNRGIEYLSIPLWHPENESMAVLTWGSKGSKIPRRLIDVKSQHECSNEVSAVSTLDSVKLNLAVKMRFTFRRTRRPYAALLQLDIDKSAVKCGTYSRKSKFLLNVY